MLFGERFQKVRRAISLIKEKANNPFRQVLHLRKMQVESRRSVFPEEQLGMKDPTKRAVPQAKFSIPKEHLSNILYVS